MKGETVITLDNIGYQGSITPALTKISPRWGTVVGGTAITFTGTNFSTTTSKYNIVIDGIVCPVSAATSTSITCTTGSRPGLIPTSLVMTITGVGSISTRGLTFQYVNVWSADTTWGGDFAPMDGDSLYVPKGLNLLVDIDRSPILKSVLVEGSLLFMPKESSPAQSTDADHLRTFDAMYIFVRGGYMEVGTALNPYTSKITITMHGTVEDPYIPIYGNKVIALRFGTLEMHGIVRDKTWTLLASTAAVGATTITLNEVVDWKVGEQIAIASTSYKGREGEKRFITAIDRTTPAKPVLTLDKALLYKHFAATETYGTDTIDMRAEVGLLTRNVVYRGDPETSTP